MATKTKKNTAPKKAEVKPPRSVVKKQVEEIGGERPLSPFDYRFCQIYVETGKASEAYRQLEPEAKDPRRSAFRMMERPEIREHIRAIFREVSKSREQAAKISARSVMLSLEVADDRLMEVLSQRRRSRAEMLTRDAKMLLVKGAMPTFDDNGDFDSMEASPKLLEEMAEEAAPVEDADLLKAIKLTYERKQGIVKAEKPPERGPVSVLLYKPKWFGQPRQAPMLEGSTA